ncbi:MAG: hypothetical protein K0S71_2060 [Clostridia bacterium]|jgi:uncharacterized membrane protein (UPF0127 family)|nr:hypothetical protein [Clostridia bacterium]
MIKTLRVEGNTIAHAFIAETFFERLWGYMFRERPHHEAIVFTPCSSIHTYFMKFPIDVLFIDDNMYVIKKIEKLEKRKLIMPVKKAKVVIEGKKGLFEKIEIGTHIELI